MALQIRKSAERGYFDHGWLKTYHTFSFGDYVDLRHRNFRKLRVINEDRVAAVAGFPEHSHQDMEIVTTMLHGTLAHQDSMGNRFLLNAGDVQRMSAGTGVTHSEFNHSSDDTVHLLQIWIFPEKKGLPPSYEQRSFKTPDTGQEQPLTLLVSPDGRENSLKIHQDVFIYRGILPAGESLSIPLLAERGLWIQLIEGTLKNSQKNPI